MANRIETPVLMYLRRTVLLTVAGTMLSSCYIFNFFKQDSKGHGGGGSVFAGAVIGQPLGGKAGGPDEAALAAVYAVSTTHAPAIIRPDPDMIVRRLLREYRAEGATVARQIGQVEKFRLLLGGASQDFAKAPQESYDATSLLAVFKVAEETCRGLVAPNAAEHGNWQTILPYGADDETGNVRWLAQRLTGRPSAAIDDATVAELRGIMANERDEMEANWWAHGNDFAKYIPACATLALDAAALYL